MALDSAPDDLDDPLGQETVNGTTLRLEWDRTEGYTLLFPQVDPHLDPLDPINPFVQIGRDDKRAECVLTFARQLARQMTNTDEICRRVGEYARRLAQNPSPESISIDSRERINDLEAWASGEREIFQP